METSCSDRKFWFLYFLFTIIIGGILVLFLYITRLTPNEIFSPSNKIHWEVGRSKDLSAPLYNPFNKILIPYWNFVELHNHNKPNTNINLSKTNQEFYNKAISYITRNITNVWKINRTYVQRILLQKSCRKLFNTHRSKEGTRELFQWLHYILRPACRNIQIELTCFYGTNVLFPNAP